jgi:uncharacterized protein (TIGR02001 family)
MSRTLRIAASLLTLAALAPAAPLRADEAPSSAASQPESPHSLTGTLLVASDYRSRGLSQTFAEGFELGPSIQGGIDYAHTSGFYAGNWNYNVSSNQYNNGSSIEMDVYGGYKRPIGPFTLDVGSILFYYPRAEARGLVTRSGGVTTESYDHLDLYAGGSWGNFSFRYMYALTDYFGYSEDAVVALDRPDDTGRILGRNRGTSGSQFLTTTWTQPLTDAFSLTTGASYLWVKNYGDLNYLEYRFGFNYVLQGWSLGTQLVGTTADRSYYYAIDGGGKVQDIGKPTLMFSVSRTL